MSTTIKNLIYSRDERIYMTPHHIEYDVTDHIEELIEKLEDLRGG